MEKIKTLLSKLTCRQFAWTMVGTAIRSFGIYNIHRRATITEGGVIGLVLLLDHWLRIPASISSPLLQHKSGGILSPVGEFPTDVSGFVSLPTGRLYSGRYVRGNRRRNYCSAGRFQRRR